MRVRRYQEKDFDSLLKWLDDREVPRFKREFLPKRGWIVDDVAAAFLIKPDCKLGIIDFFVTNPKISQEVRLQACDLMIVEIQKEAMKLGMLALSANTKLLKVQAHAVRHGFKYDPSPYYFVFKNLGDSTDVRRIDRAHDESKPTNSTHSGTSRNWQVV